MEAAPATDLLLGRAVDLKGCHAGNNVLVDNADDIGQ